MRLAKPHLDIGLFTNDIASQRAFWANDVGLRLDHELTLDPEWVQHRFDAHDSVIKVNHVTAKLRSQPRSGYVELAIASDEKTSWQGVHPDGDRVRLVASGTDGIVGIGITVRTSEPQRLMDFYVNAMEFEASAENVARCGDSLLFVEKGRGGQVTDSFKGSAFRYLTVQVYDADAACDDIVARGGTLGLAPVSFGDIARYGFVCDPDGNWIEMSARTSLTGIAPPA